METLFTLEVPEKSISSSLEQESGLIKVNKYFYCVKVVVTCTNNFSTCNSNHNAVGDHLANFLSFPAGEEATSTQDIKPKVSSSFINHLVNKLQP